MEECWRLLMMMRMGVAMMMMMMMKMMIRGGSSGDMTTHYGSLWGVRDQNSRYEPTPHIECSGRSRTSYCRDDRKLNTGRCRDLG